MEYRNDHTREREVTYVGTDGHSSLSASLKVTRERRRINAYLAPKIYGTTRRSWRSGPPVITIEAFVARLVVANQIDAILPRSLDLSQFAKIYLTHLSSPAIVVIQISGNFLRLVFPRDKITRERFIINEWRYLTDTANEDSQYFQTYFILISLANEKAAAPNTESVEHVERKN